VKFIDEVTITVQSGDGGRGCVSFRRERFIPRGGPDGGDGGKGGDVIFHVTPRKRTLYHLRNRKHYPAAKGQNGQGSQRTGAGGADLVIEVPAGTLVIDADTGETLFDLVQPRDKVVVAKGGRGGQGNLRFKTSTNRAPKFAQPGEPGQTLNLRLELKLLADVGIIGLPNAGKSTLISVLSAARPKIADYPFTTLTPNLGVVHIPGSEPLIAADIPGLIEGAHSGTGLGIRFLKHVERTRILLHLIDASALDPDDPLAPYRAVNHEMRMYSAALAQKPQLVVLNKLDVPEAEELARRFCQALPDGQVIRVSAAARHGLDNLKSSLVRKLEQPDDCSES
jgi:GTP-binding protein